MADRVPLIRDGTTNLVAELQPGDTLALVAMNASLQSLVAGLIVSSTGAPLVTSAGDFITTSAA